MSGENEDIAIIGMAGLYPQADDVDVFWSNILHKVDAVTTSSDDWLGDGSILDPESDATFRIYTRRGGFLGDLSRFDPRQFGTMPLSVSGAQPDQFLGLKVAHDALVDAGYMPGKFDGSGTGVILGHAVHAHRGNTNGIHQAWFNSQLRGFLRAIFPALDPDRVEAAIRMMEAKIPRISSETVPGLVPNILTGRIANRLDLMGPNYIIDAACSSSLIAVDLAIHELRAGRADMMLAGGVNTTTSPLVYSVFCSVNALSREGRIRPFDEGANGTVLGEGAGVLVLKRLKDAVAADDRIYAVIKGVGQSSDGKSSGLMAPRLEGEVLAMRRAYRQTGIDPASIGLIEAHGTGIPLGDRTEIDAMRQVFGSRAGDLPVVPIGSVKSMIGHCIPASGSAAMIKLALALRHKVIPPTLCDSPSEHIGLETTPFFLATEARPWVHSADHPRRAAINAFGFGGINAHMILEESPVGRAADPTAAFLRPVAGAPGPSEQVFVFAGADRAAILAGLDAYEAAQPAGGAELAALAAERWDAVAQHPGPARLAIVASDLADLGKKIATAREKLAAAKARSLQTRNGIYFEEAPIGGKVAFLFPGEMAQYPNMMRDAALAFPAVRDWFDFISSLTEGRRGTRLQDVIFPPETGLGREGTALLEDLIHRVDYGSEMVFAADQAVFAVLTAMGLRPDALLGHSTGENAALVASGLLRMDRRAVGEMIARMNLVFDEVQSSGAVPTGVLLNVAALARPDLEAVLAAHPGVHFTMDNCPNQAILFGQPEEIDAVTREAVAMGAVCTRLPISWGYHTHYVAPMAEEFQQLFEGLGIEEGDEGPTLYSCATAAPFPRADAGAKATAIAQYTSRVRFTEAVQRLWEDGHRVFVECGPNTVLSGFVRDILGERPHLAVSADNRRRGMLSQLRHLFGQLFAAGVPVDARDVLLRREDAAQLRRRLAREKSRAAPHLPSELPFVQLSEAEGAELARSLFGEAVPGVAALAQAAEAPTPPPAPAIVAEALQAPAATALAPQPALASAAPQALAQVGNAAAAPSAAPGSAGRGCGRAAQSRPAPVRPRGPSGPVRRAPLPSQEGLTPDRIEMLDLSDRFSPPFAFAATLMRGLPTPEGILVHLTVAERAEAGEVMLRRAASAWTEWSLGRLAAKRSASLLFERLWGQSPATGALGIRKEEGGRPFLAVEGLAAGLPDISISHVGSVGVGVAGQPDWRVGIDYEQPDRIRDPEGFLAAITSPEEWARLGLPVSQDSAVLAWSAKEAAAKAIGQGIQGRPREFALWGGDGRGVDLRVQHGSHVVEAQARRIGDAICVMAWIPGLGSAAIA